MEERINVNVKGDTLILRKGDAEKIIGKKPFEIIGDIKTPLNFLLKRKDSNVDFSTSNLQIEREKLSVVLTLFENSELESSVTGKLEKTEEFNGFGINSGKKWVARNLAEFIKMNRACFSSKEKANELAAILSDVKIRIDKVIEDNSGSRGNLRKLKEQTLKECNIPETIELTMPIFKGANNSIFVCEVWIDPDEYTVTLVSPDAADIIREVRDKEIDDVKNTIEDICEELVIIEK